MKILLISQLYPAYPGQTAASVSHALHHLARRWAVKEDVLVVRPYFVPDVHHEETGVSKQIFELDGVKILTFPVFKIPKTRFFYFRKLYKELKKMNFRPQVVTAHLGYCLHLGDRIARHFKVPFISAVHFGDFLYAGKMLGPKRLKKIYHRSEGIACRSPVVHCRFVESYPELKDRAFIAYSGIEKELIQTRGFAIKKLHQWYGKKRPTIKLISACSLVKLKNIDVTLHALARLGSGVDWTYTIIGDGPERSDLESLAKDLRIASRVTFMGQRPRAKVLEEMKKSHVFIQVSSPETFGLVYLEAMASGCIVIGARGCGIDGVIEHGKNGFLCQPRDDADIRRTLDLIVSGVNPKNVVIQSHKTVEEYTEEKAANNYLLQIYKCTYGE